MNISSLIQSIFGFKQLKVYDPKHQHFIGYDGQYKYYVIVTTQVLRNSTKVFGRNYGEMLGVRFSILIGDYDYIVWVIERGSCYEVYVERSYRVYSFCNENKTIYRNPTTSEHVCNYPIALAKKVFEKCINRTLLDYVSK